MVNLFCTLRQIILASQSPRRQHFLKDLGIEYLLYSDLLLKNKETLSSTIIDRGDMPDRTERFDRNACSHGTLACGIRAKDDKEERPNPLELPEDYVFRAAFGKLLDAVKNLGFIHESIDAESIDAESIDVEGNNSTQTFLDMGKKETLSLSYSVEKYPFRSNVLCYAQSLPPKFLGVLAADLPHTINREELKNPIFITADTIVALDDEILGKPYDEAHALDMLRRMVGREHRVLTTVCVADLEKKCIYSFTDIAHVHFAPWSIKLLEAYIKTGDPMDKAGSYGIQGVGMFLSDGIQGSWDTVAGLPVAKLLELLLYSKAIQIV